MASVIEGKDLDPDDKAYIAKLVSENHQDIYFQDWVKLYYQDKNPKKRILVITNFRLLTIKVNVLGMGRSVRQSFPILDLTRMHVAKDNPSRMVLEFGVSFSPATFQYDVPGGVLPIAQTILFSYQAITFGQPPNLLPKIELPGEFLTSFAPPEPDDQDGLLATYLAQCDYQKLEQRLPVLDYLMTCFQLNDHVLDLGECLSFLDKENKTDIVALTSALRFSKWFQEISAVGYQLKNDGLIPISNLLTIPTAVNKLILVSVKAGKTGFGTLAKAFAKGVHNVTFLNASKNNLADIGLKSLADGLMEGKKVLHTLCLRACGFSSKGFKSLTTMLEAPTWLAGLKILDVSDNRLAKDGTKALAQWLEKPGCAIEQLYLVSTELECEILFEAIQSNKNLCTRHLKTLNISGNKIGKKALAALVGIMESSGSCSQILLSNANVGKEFFSSILEAALKNKVQGMSFSLDVSGNNLGTKGAKDLDTLFMDWLKRDPRVVTEAGKIHTLILSDNNLSVEGIVTICKALRGTSVHSLGLDRNVKLGVFSSGEGNEVGDALAGLINNTPHLKELTISGSDSHYLKNALLPLLLALGKNTSLQHLDISKNRLGDQGVLALATAIQENGTLKSFNVEGNKVSFKSLAALHEATTKNKSLIDWVIPMEDIHKLLKGASEKKVRELRQIVHDLETNMERNDASRGEGKGGVMNEMDDILRMRSHSRMGAMDDPMLSSHVRKTASRLFDSMVQQQIFGGGFPRQSEPGAPGGSAEGEEEGDKKKPEARSSLRLTSPMAPSSPVPGGVPTPLSPVARPPPRSPAVVAVSPRMNSSRNIGESGAD